MTRDGSTGRRIVIATVCVVGAALCSGCRARERVAGVSIANATGRPMTIAVAPALNLSGSSAFDANGFADLMASELSFVEGVSVIPVSRVLGALSAQGMDRVSTASHALELTSILGADGILVFAVTEYDPYDPPSIGLSAQLYGSWPVPRGGALDPVSLSRRPGLSGEEGRSRSRGLLAQSQRVFNASHRAVTADVRSFARLRGAEHSPYGWRKYVVSQRHYIRYCCHAMLRTLFDMPVSVGSTPQTANGRTVEHEHRSAGKLSSLRLEKSR